MEGNVPSGHHAFRAKYIFLVSVIRCQCLNFNYGQGDECQ